jgi:hypothetical protein
MKVYVLTEMKYRMVVIYGYFRGELFFQYTYQKTLGLFIPRSIQKV